MSPILVREAAETLDQERRFRLEVAPDAEEVRWPLTF